MPSYHSTQEYASMEPQKLVAIRSVPRSNWETLMKERKISKAEYSDQFSLPKRGNEEQYSQQLSVGDVKTNTQYQPTDDPLVYQCPLLDWSFTCYPADGVSRHISQEDHFLHDEDKTVSPEQLIYGVSSKQNQNDPSKGTTRRPNLLPYARHNRPIGRQEPGMSVSSTGSVSGRGQRVHARLDNIPLDLGSESSKESFETFEEMPRRPGRRLYDCDSK